MNPETVIAEAIYDTHRAIPSVCAPPWLDLPPTAKRSYVEAASAVLAAINEHWLLVSRDPSDPQREAMEVAAANVDGLRSTLHGCLSTRDAQRVLLAALSPEEETE